MTETLATIFGIYMLCAGLGLILNRGWAHGVMDDLESSPALTYICGAVVLIAGLALVMNHNLWNGWPEIAVTLIGWGAAIEGAILLIYPKALYGFARLILPSEKIVPIFGIITLALGAALIWL